jgi:hypothetical protein
LYADLYASRDQIKWHTQTSQKHTYTLFLVPHTSTLATRILEEEGVLGEITVSSYNLQFIPLEEDVVSLKYDTAFKEIWVVSSLKSALGVWVECMMVSRMAMKR